MQGNREKNKEENNNYAQGLDLLRQPILPLIHMVQFFYLTGSFSQIQEIISELPAPIETAHAVYPNPAELLDKYSDLLIKLEKLKQDDPVDYLVIDEANTPIDRLTTISSWVNQQILTRELEQINSLLCGACRCSLCCNGPDAIMKHEFFEIPLTDHEAHRFTVPVVDSSSSTKTSAMTEPALMIDGHPFYNRPEPALFNWQAGWSLIMPKNTCCPNLEKGTGRCTDYIHRPEVCRRPQIFPYLLERVPEHDISDANSTTPAFRLRQSLLAITDCPYVQDLRDEIARYAAASELELIFKQNKN